MFKIETYITNLITLLQQSFGERLLYVGLQGSYLRNEATENSDIDIMVVIDEFSVRDLDIYKEAIILVGYYEKSCGFICGKAELQNWNPFEICNLLHSTKDYYGKLKELLPTYTNEDVRNFVKTSLNNLFHEICHRYIHSGNEKNVTKIVYTYKSVFFILQNITYLNSGVFALTKKELLTLLSGKDRLVLEIAICLSEGGEYDFGEVFSLLFTWCQETMIKI